ncbi:uncharacterized protein SCHCODRAFT_02704954 [Schizophyllum commune H4-8]|uniref:uncharacterized protein n=1 Tax=Schizophyllum commune (strain H4-8 / FGSC 9210) TaxID=578458 RepID=UPI0021601CEC|nr:uncharacterized protein SCHCODRAFT_02704954 [Schizophyllum commune H4-8]KAI5887593.1 hypothetical protein SCHCODRAFT_02704954 [Schizophyllum commune H4-8]
MTFPLHAALPLQLWSLPSSSAVVAPELLCRFKTERNNLSDELGPRTSAAAAAAP